MTDPTEDRMGGAPAVATKRRPLSVSQRAVFLELAELGVRPEAAALMARRQPVRADVVRGLRLKQAFDGHQAEHDAYERWVTTTVGPRGLDVSGATPEFGKVSAADLNRVATAALAQKVDAAFARVPDAAALETQMAAAQPQYKPVVLAGGADRGGAEDLGGPVLVRTVPMGEYAAGKTINHQAVGSAVPDAAPVASPRSAASGTASPNGQLALPDRARASVLSRHQAVASERQLGTALDVLGMVTGVIAPPVGIALVIARHLAARADGFGGL